MSSSPQELQPNLENRDPGEGRLKLILWDEEECWKLIRLYTLLAGMGLVLVVKEVNPKGR